MDNVVIVGVFIVLLGVFEILIRKPFARFIVRSSPSYGSKGDEFRVRLHSYTIGAIGMFFVVLGLVVLLNALSVV